MPTFALLLVTTFLRPHSTRRTMARVKAVTCTACPRRDRKRRGPVSIRTDFQANPDVAAWAGGDPAKAGQHYQQFGAPEGREGFGLMARQAAQGGGPGGQPYQTWNPSPMGGGAAERNAMAIALMNQGRGMNMPSGFGGSTYAQNNMYGAPSSGYLGAQGANVQDPFSGYVNPEN